MNFNDIIDSVIASINADISTLNGLLNNTENLTLRSDDPLVIPAPEYDDVAETWKIRQDTPNGGGVYEGVYRLPQDTNCTRLEIVSIDAYDPPASGAPARLKPCVSVINPTPVYIDQPSVEALDGECCNNFVIRSDAPFDITLRLTDCIPVLFEWESSASNTLEGCTAKPRVILRIDGGGVLPNDVEVDITVVGGTATGDDADYNLFMLHARGIGNDNSYSPRYPHPTFS